MATPDHTIVEIKLTHGQITVVSAEDADLAALRWRAHFNNQYRNGGAFRARRDTAHINGRSRTELLHRVILARVLGRELKRSEHVDHIDGDPLNNHRTNLRLATRAENARNRGKNTNNSSGYKGVRLRKGTQRWQARIKAGGKERHLGYFDTREEAARAYDAAARELHGAFARLNFPDERAA